MATAAVWGVLAFISVSGYVPGEAIPAFVGATGGAAIFFIWVWGS